MNCPHCNTELRKGMKFCPSCGVGILQKHKCPQCGNLIKEGLLFCNKCGAQISSNLSLHTSIITIHGYEERFVVNPNVSIYIDDKLVGEISRKEAVNISVEKECKLKFKYSFRTTEVYISNKENLHIFLSFNRFTGALNALNSGEKDSEQVKTAISIKSRMFTILSILLCISLVIGTSVLYYRDKKTKNGLEEHVRNAATRIESNTSADYDEKQIEEKIRRLVNSYNMAANDYRVQLEMGESYRIVNSLKNARNELEQIRQFAEETNNSGLLRMYYEQDRVINIQERELGIK